MKLIPGMLALALFAALPSCVVTDTGASSSGSYNTAGEPYVTKRPNGNYLVTHNGNTASYRSSGALIEHSGMSLSELSEAQQAVNGFMRGGSGGGYSGDGVPEVNQRRDGNIEVSMPSGCVILYNSNGVLIQKGSSCSSSELYQANRAVRSFLNEQNSSFNDV